MIPQETVQKILDTARVEEVIGDFVALRRRGAEFWACCPFHNEKTPSFHIMPAKGSYYCFGCHKGGSAVGFIMDYEHMSYVEALRYLARKYHIEVVESEETAEDIASRQRSESLMLVSEFAGGFFREQLATTEGRSVALAYFHSRGLEDATIEKYGLGWAPSGRSAFTAAAREKGFKEEYLLDTGLCARYETDGQLHDRFYERVVFPIHSVSGRVVAFGARTLRSDKTVAKYVNSKESDIYVKNKSLYGIWFAKNEMARKNKCYLVEGYLDVLSMHQLGITNVVASSGTALTEGQIRLIRRFTENVTIMYDGDAAGIHAALRGIDMFLREGMNVKVVLIPDGDDPDSYARKHTLEEMEAFLAASEQDFVTFKASLLLEGTERDPLRRAEVINDIADSIAQIPDAVKRTVYVDFLSREFDIRPAALEERLSRARTKILEEERVKVRREAQAQGGQQGASPDVLPAGAETAPPAVAVNADPLLESAERDLLNFILADGTDPLVFASDSEFYPGDGEEMPTVFEFIASAVEDDGAAFTHPAFERAYRAYAQFYDEGLSQDEIVKRLLDGEDRTVAAVAAALSGEEKYTLTISGLRNAMMSRPSWLTKYVPKAILVFQEARLEHRLAQLRGELAADGAPLETLLQQIKDMQQMLHKVKVRLGREKE